MKVKPKTPDAAQRAWSGQRPRDRRPVMYQSWDHLLFLHWPVDPEIIQQTLPPGLWVDAYDGRAYLGIVPFFMKDIRPRRMPAIPYLSYFLECNVRTYVHDVNGIPGVWFYSLDTDRWLAHWTARRFFHLPYYWAKMSATHDDKSLHYSLRRRSKGDRANYQFRPTSAAVPAQPNTLDHYLLERYLLYSYREKKQQLYRGQVHHQPYRAASVELTEYSTAPITWNALPEVKGKPVHTCLANRVDVEIFPIEPCDGTSLAGDRRAPLDEAGRTSPAFG